MELSSLSSVAIKLPSSFDNVTAKTTESRVVSSEIKSEIYNNAPAPEQVQEALAVVNKAALIEQRSLSFTLDELSGRSIITVKDSSTEQVIRQIPSEELLRVAQDIKKLQEEMGSSLGLLINNQV